MRDHLHDIIDRHHGLRVLRCVHDASLLSSVRPFVPLVVLPFGRLFLRLGRRPRLTRAVRDIHDSRRSGRRRLGRPHHFAHQCDRPAVTGSEGGQVRPHTPAGQGEIAHAIHRFVPHELVRPSERGVDHAGVAEHDRVGSGRTPNQSLCSELVYLVHEAKGAGRRQVPAEGGLIDNVSSLLTPDQRVREIDRDLQSQVRCRVGLVDRRAVNHADRLSQFQILGRLDALRHPGAHEGIEKWAGASVEDRRFRSVHVDDQIVDLRRHHGREHVLHRVHLGAGGRADQLCAALAECGVLHARRNLGRTGQIDSTEDDARPLRRRPERDPAVQPEMQPDALQHHRPGNRLAPRSLRSDLDHFAPSVPPRVSPCTRSSAAARRSSAR